MYPICIHLYVGEPGCTTQSPIGVGARYALAPPSEPYGRFSRIRLSRKAVSSWRLQCQAARFHQTEIPELVKVGVWPFLMIAASPPSPFALMLAQDAPQPPSNPSVDIPECRPV